MDLTPFSGLRLFDNTKAQECISLLPYLHLFLFGMLTRWCTTTWKSPLVLSSSSFIGSTATGSLRTLLANTSMNSRTKALSLVRSWMSIVRGFHPSRQWSLHRKDYAFNQCHHRTRGNLLNAFILCEHAVSEGVPSLRSVETPWQRVQGIVVTLGYKACTIVTRQ